MSIQRPKMGSCYAGFRMDLLSEGFLPFGFYPETSLEQDEPKKYIWKNWRAVIFWSLTKCLSELAFSLMHGKRLQKVYQNLNNYYFYKMDMEQPLTRSFVSVPCARIIYGFLHSWGLLPTVVQKVVEENNSPAPLSNEKESPHKDSRELMGAVQQVQRSICSRNGG